MRPDLLLMDEPYGQMDIKLRFYLEDEVLRLWREIGTTVLFITHNIEEAVYLSERVLILSNKPATIKESLQKRPPISKGYLQPGLRGNEKTYYRPDQVVVNAKNMKG